MPIPAARVTRLLWIAALQWHFLAADSVASRPAASRAKRPQNAEVLTLLDLPPPKKKGKRTVCDGDTCQLVDEEVDDIALSFATDSAAGGIGALCDALDQLRSSCTDAQFSVATKLLLKYCENAAGDPQNAKFRSIRVSNSVFQRHLAPHEPAAACLEAIGFELKISRAEKKPGRGLVGADGAFELRLPDVSLLQSAQSVLRAERRSTDLQPRWPPLLSHCLTAVCRRMRDEPPELLQALADEFAAPHITELLEYRNNRNSIGNALLELTPALATGLTAQLREIRHNVTEIEKEEAAQAAAARAAEDEASPAASSQGRVREIDSVEEWYDVLMEDSSRIVVADFGAAWCGPCQSIKPLFEELSSRYPAVTFVSLDADKLPVLMGENMVDSFPTFKFFRAAAEADLPVVGADIASVESRLKSLL